MVFKRSFVGSLSMAIMVLLNPIHDRTTSTATEKLIYLSNNFLKESFHKCAQ